MGFTDRISNRVAKKVLNSVDPDSLLGLVDMALDKAQQDHPDADPVELRREVYLKMHEMGVNLPPELIDLCRTTSMTGQPPRGDVA